MLSEFQNVQENFLTRVSTVGLLNVRKMELTQKLLQDINIFHAHPARMPDDYIDAGRLLDSAVANMKLNDKQQRVAAKPPRSLQNQLSTSSIHHTSKSSATARQIYAK